jgi:hypothetical protein
MPLEQKVGGPDEKSQHDTEHGLVFPVCPDPKRHLIHVHVVWKDLPPLLGRGTQKTSCDFMEPQEWLKARVGFQPAGAIFRLFSWIFSGRVTSGSKPSFE